MPAASGREMGQALEHLAIDLVVLDLMLPDADGIRVCEEFERARATHSNAPDLDAKRSHSPGYGEHLQRRAGVFGGVERVWSKNSQTLSLCRDLRAKSNLPVLMLTARGEEAGRIVGIEVGADDPLVKPFSPRELLARQVPPLS